MASKKLFWMNQVSSPVRVKLAREAREDEKSAKTVLLPVLNFYTLRNSKLKC